MVHLGHLLNLRGSGDVCTGVSRPETAREQQMRELYAAHAPVVLAFAVRYTRDRAQAEDLVQETMVRAWRSLDRLEADPRSWLLTVARNLLTDQWRAGRARPLTTVLDLADEGRQPPGAVAEVDAAVERLVIGEAVARLTPEHREVVVAVHYEGRSVAETARLLGIPEGTVKSRCYYALRALRSSFEEMGLLR